MAYFMIDMENTHGGGLKGAQYLEPSDSVIIFYSESCNQIEQGILRDIFASGCQVELCKLIKKGDNALDFYIASKIGLLFGSGYSESVVIISGDKGLLAVNHYWQNYGSPHRSVPLRPNIEQGILALGEKTPRRQQIKEALTLIDMEQAVAEHDEALRIHRELEILFADTPQKDKLPQIMNIISDHTGAGKVLYLSALKQFGKKDGLEIYRKLRLLNWRNSLG